MIQSKRSITSYFLAVLPVILPAAFLVVLLSSYLIFSGCASRQPRGCLTDGQVYCVTSEWAYRLTWDACYRRGLSCEDGECWEYATEEFRQAIALRFQDKRNVRAYGLHFLDEYFPHRELGICYFYLGRTEDALKELELSVSHTPSARAKHYLNQVRRAHLLATGKDTIPPSIRMEFPVMKFPAHEHLIEFPAQEHLTNQTPIQIQGTVQDDQFVAAISVNHTLLFIELARPVIPFTSSADLEEGWNTLEVTATDLVDRQDKKSIQVYLDQQGPLVIARASWGEQAAIGGEHVAIGGKQATGASATDAGATDAGAKGASAADASAAGVSATDAGAAGVSATDAGPAGVSATDAGATGASATGVSATGASATDGGATGANAAGVSVTDASATDGGATGASAAGVSVTDAGVADAGAADASATGAGQITLTVLIYDRSGIVSFHLNGREVPKAGLDQLWLIEETISPVAGIESIPFWAQDRAGNITRGEVSLLPGQRKPKMAMRLASMNLKNLVTDPARPPTSHSPCLPVSPSPPPRITPFFPPPVSPSPCLPISPSPYYPISPCSNAENLLADLRSMASEVSTGSGNYTSSFVGAAPPQGIPAATGDPCCGRPHGARAGTKGFAPTILAANLPPRVVSKAEKEGMEEESTQEESISLDIVYPPQENLKTYYQEIFLEGEIEAHHGIRKIELNGRELSHGKVIKEIFEENLPELIQELRKKNQDAEARIKTAQDILRGHGSYYLNQKIPLRAGLTTFVLRVEDNAGHERSKQFQVWKIDREEVLRSEERMRLVIMPFDVEAGSDDYGSDDHSDGHQENRQEDYQNEIDLERIRDKLFKNFVQQGRFNLSEQEKLPRDLIEEACRTGKVCSEEVVQQIGDSTLAEGVICGSVRRWMDGIEIKAWFQETEKGRQVIPLQDVFTPLNNEQNREIIISGLAMKFRDAFPICEGEITQVDQGGQIVYTDIGSEICEGIRAGMMYNIFLDQRELIDKARIEEVKERESEAKVSMGTRKGERIGKRGETRKRNNRGKMNKMGKIGNTGKKYQVRTR